MRRSIAGPSSASGATAVHRRLSRVADAGRTHGVAAGDKKPQDVGQKAWRPTDAMQACVVQGCGRSPLLRRQATGVAWVVAASGR